MPVYPEQARCQMRLSGMPALGPQAGVSVGHDYVEWLALRPETAEVTTQQHWAFKRQAENQRAVEAQ